MATETGVVPASTVVLSRVIKAKHPLAELPLSSTSRKKIEEYRALGLPVLEAEEVDEIQSSDAFRVIEAKAKRAYETNGIPTLVDDTSLEIDAEPGSHGPLVKLTLGDMPKMQSLCSRLPQDNRGATFRVLLGVWDGYELHIREGKTRGTIADAPRGDPEFGFDVIFIPDGDTRTYGQMTYSEKSLTAPRTRAAQKWIEEPVIVGENVYLLPEAEEVEVNLVLKERLVDSPAAIKFAYSLDALEHVKPNAELLVDTFAPVSCEDIRDASGRILLSQYKVGKSNTASSGLVIMPSVELKTVAPVHARRARAVRLSVDVSTTDGPTPVLLQMGTRTTELALASRAMEYKRMHNKNMHARVRELIAKGEKGQTARANKRSEALEALLGMDVRTDQLGTHNIIKRATKIIAATEIAYVRKSSKRKVSRKQAARMGLMSIQAGLPTMPIALGGMPPTSGSADTLATAAMSYMRSWVPHNGVFAGDYQRQLNLFAEAKAKIYNNLAPEDADIADVCVKQIGISVGCEDPAAIAEQARKFKAMGGRSMRIYTTNPGVGVTETAKAIRDTVGEDFTICVGPIADIEQARELVKAADVNMFIVGHGAGENCTSLEGGGAANAIALLYEMSLDPMFNDRIRGMEGGVGTSYGSLLPLCDFFSLNGKVVGGIEPTGGLFVQHSSGMPVLPYHGSASIITQKTEAFIAPNIRAKRLGEDGLVENVEGKPNYKARKAWANSITSFFRVTRAYMGAVLADMDALDIFEYRNNIAENGYELVGVTTEAHASANDHRNRI